MNRQQAHVEVRCTCGWNDTAETSAAANQKADDHLYRAAGDSKVEVDEEYDR
jgi:hypothetical protein